LTGDPLNSTANAHSALNIFQLTDKEFNQLRTLVYDRWGIKLGDQKRSLVAGRLQKIVKEVGCNDFSDYINYLENDASGKAMGVLIDRISTNHTFFWRENDHFQYFSKTILPEVIGRLKTRREHDLRIWCPGCSSGEEPFTLAMLVSEYLGKEMVNWDVGILATDISNIVLTKAQIGKYSDENVNHLPNDLKYKYLHKQPDKQWLIDEKIKKMVLYRRLNLMRESYPFRKQFQIIFCRNVMIYFDVPTRQELVSRFYRYCETDGYLFIGHSETLGRNNTLFKYVNPAIYKRN